MKKRTFRLLLIEDNPGDARLVKESLTEDGGEPFQLDWTNNLAAGLARLSNTPFDVVLLDLSLPDSSGLSTFEQVHTVVPRTPIILLTGLDDQDLARKVMRQGAQDYLIKGDFSGRMLGRLIRYAIERKLAEEALRESEIKFRQTFDLSPAGIVMVGLDKRFLLCNQAFAQALGCSVEELIGKTIADVTFPEDREIGMPEMAAVLKREIDNSRFQKRYLRKDGGIVWGEIIISLIRDSQERPQYFLGIIQDITERKLSEEKLQHSETQYRSLTENSPDLIARFDQQYRHLYVNPAAAKAGRYIPEEYISKTMVEVGVPKPEARKWEAHIKSVFETAQIVDVEDSFETPSGLQYFNTKFIPEVAPDGSIQSVQSIARDITERKRAEEVTRESEQNYRTLAESGQALIWTSGTDKLCDYFNRIWLEFTGRKLNQEIGNGWLEGVHPEDLQRCLDIYVGAFDRRKKFSMEYRLRRHDGEYRWIQDDGCPRYDSNGEFIGYIGHCLDITGRKQAEQKISELNAELEQRVIERTTQLEAANRELESFNYSISHDLRTPLRAINGFAQIIKEDYAAKLDDEGNELLDSIRANSSKMGQLINDLLDFSRAGRTELNWLDVEMTALANSIFQEITDPEARRTFNFSAAPLPAAYGDPSLLRQVWINLISNAVKFTLPKKKRKIEIGGYTGPDSTVYHVKDNGVGFDPAFTDKLFGVFQRLHSVEEFEGTGVGLAIVKRIIERHGGRVWAESEVDKGATFYFTLPKQRK